jgi:thiamine-monophosphate kinase
MDVSDGLLIDAERLAAASGVALEIDLDAVPLSRPAVSLDDLLARVTAGDDYELLFSLPENAKSLPAGGGPVTAVGRVLPGTGVSLKFGGKPIPLPPRLGWEHT